MGNKERFKIISAVYLVLRHDDSVLLSRRYNTGFHDGEYSLPAGHLNGNETLTQAMIREAKEEIGVELKEKDLELVHVMHRKELDGERVNFFFVATTWEGEPKIMEPHKCDDLSWFPFGNFPSNTIPYIKQALDCVSRKVSYSEYGW